MQYRLLAGLVVLAACGAPEGGAADAAAPDAEPFADAGPCDDHTLFQEPEASYHVPADEPVAYAQNPPSSGPHDPRWARWQRTYDDPPMRREHWVHNLEHGGVVLLYRCPLGCPDVVAQLEAVQASLSTDPKCLAPLTSRTLITADPLLPADAPIAAVAWGRVYTAQCVDAVTLKAFIERRRGFGPEDTCAQGQVPAAE
jgi:hypothetical protein